MLPSGDRQIHLLDYWQVILKRRVGILFTTALTLIGAFVFNQVASPVYQARSRLLIEEKLEDVNLTKNILLPYQKEFFDTQREILESEPVFEESVMALGLATQPIEPGIVDVIVARIKDVLGLGWDLSPEQLQRDAIEKAMTRLRKQVSISGLRGTNILEILVEHKDPNRARDIANTLSHVFIERSLYLKNKDSRDSARFLENQVENLRQRLNEGENRLEEFQFSQEAISLDKRIEFLVEQQIVVAERDYEEARLDLEQERERVEVLSLQVQKERSRKSSGDKGTDKILAEQKILLELKLSDLKRKFTDQHPEVIAIRRSLDLLKQQLDDEQKASAMGLQQASNEFLQTLEREFSEAQRNYRVLSVRVAQLEKQLQEFQERLQDMLKKKARFLVLQRELKADEELYETLLSRSKQVGVESGLNVGHVKQIEPATLPVRPVRPGKLLNLVLAVITGFFAGIGLIFLQEYLDTTLKTPDDIAPLLEDTPLVGLFHESELLRRERHLLPRIVETNPQSMLAESFRILRANLDLYFEEGMKTFILTSSIPGEGKSTTATNLALSLAQAGRRVLLVDADFRKPKLAEPFQLSQRLEPQMTSMEGLFLSTPQCMGEPARYLKSREFQTFMEEASSSYDLILIDTAPLNIVADTSDLIRLGYGVLLVVGSGKVREQDVQRAIQTLNNLNARLLGYVISRMPEEARSREYQSYYAPYIKG